MIAVLRDWRWGLVICVLGTGALTAVLTTRVGLAFGDWMRRVRR